MPAHLAHQRYWVYMMTNKPNGTLYTGVTNSLERRVREHQSGLIPGFTKQYGLKRLVYFEEHCDITAAIDREKEIKGWLRIKKTSLIRASNPLWKNLAEDGNHVQMDPSLRSG